MKFLRSNYAEKLLLIYFEFLPFNAFLIFLILQDSCSYCMSDHLHFANLDFFAFLKTNA